MKYTTWSRHADAHKYANALFRSWGRVGVTFQVKRDHGGYGRRWVVEALQVVDDTREARGFVTKNRRHRLPFDIIR